MDRNKQLAYIVIAAMFLVLLVLLIVCVMNYLSLQAANGEIVHYQQQQNQIAKAIAADYQQDMQAAKDAWVNVHHDEYTALNNQGIVIEPDYVAGAYYSALLDPSNPYYVVIGPPTDDIKTGEVRISLGQYYDGNHSRASDWSVTYIVNHTTHTVIGFTASTVQTIAYDNYMNNVAPDIYNRLGVSKDSVIGESQTTLDTSLLTEGSNSTWLDVAEHKYWLKNTDVTSYLTIKTYVNGTTQEVTDIDISQPYHSSQAIV